MHFPSLAILSTTLGSLLVAANLLEHHHEHRSLAAQIAEELQERDVEEPILEARTSLTAYTGTKPKPAHFLYDLTEGAGDQLPPDPTKLQGWNLYAMAFWHHTGPVYNAHTWAKQSKSFQKKVAANYHKHGKKLLVSAFGDEESPVHSKFNPEKTAKDLAAFVHSNNLDGADIDFEDFKVTEKQRAAWLIRFQTALRKAMGPHYIITHAPIAPWFTTDGGSYYMLHKAVGSTIDYYNIQFYNQGKDYEDCESLILGGGKHEPQAKNTALLEIAKSVPKEKLLIGKASAKYEVSYGGWTPPKTLNECVKLARKHGWNSGLMVWSWTAAEPEHYLEKVWGH